MKNRTGLKEPTLGVLTESMDISSSEFTNVQAILLNISNNQDKWQKINVQLTALKIQIEDYLNAEEPKELVPLGEFLKRYVQTFDLKQRNLADYIGVEPSNLSKMINGSRQVNYETALIIGEIFKINPSLLLKVQIKNDLIKLGKEKAEELNKYTLEDLLEVK